MGSEINSGPIKIRIATYLLQHSRAIISVEAYAPRQDRWFVLHSGFPTKEAAKEWIDLFINTSQTTEIIYEEIALKEAPNG